MKINLGLIGVLGVLTFSQALADTKVLQIDISGTPEVYKFIVAIASQTASARTSAIAGASATMEVSKYVSFAKNQRGEVVATSIGVVAVDGDLPSFPAGTIAVLRTQGKEECRVPHGNELFPLEHGISTFVVSNSGANIWEIGAIRGIISIRLVKSADLFGDWEPYRADPSKYVTYTCAKYL